MGRKNKNAHNRFTDGLQSREEGICSVLKAALLHPCWPSTSSYRT